MRLHPHSETRQSKPFCTRNERSNLLISMGEHYSSHPKSMLLDSWTNPANVGYVFDAHVWNERYNSLLLVHTVLAANLRIT